MFEAHIVLKTSKFCLYLGYPWTNFNQISTTIMGSWPATKMSYHVTLKMWVKVTVYKNCCISPVIQTILWPATKISYQQRQSCAATPCRVAHFYRAQVPVS